MYKEKSKMYSDVPIKDANRFNFEAYSDAISKIILNKENNTPFSIAINGSWGRGKTTLMKTIREKLKNESGKRNNRKVKSVWFDAWKYSETETMLAALVFEIFEEMAREKGLLDKVKAKIVGDKQINMSKILSDLLAAVTMSQVEFDKWLEDQAYKKELSFYDLFQDYMKKILMTFVLKKEEGEYSDKEGVLVIFIDDLDRCPPKQITKVLESINLFFDQEGCFFIFGVDISMIAKAIAFDYKNLEGFSGIDYIKKMIQLQFDLPAIDEKDIIEFMENELGIEDQLKIYFEIIIKGLGRNQREIKQFINSLNLMRMLGESIKIQGYEEELLIKWSILNFSSKDFVEEVNKKPELIIEMEKISNMKEDFQIDEYTETLKEPYKSLCKIFNKNEKILNILHSGEKKFKETDISGYIFLSSVAPKELEKIPLDVESGKEFKIALTKLPSTNPELFGRENELAILDTVWANSQTNIVSLVAWGGVGKTALVNTWLSKMRLDNFRGAERVFGWSFYSQGAAEGKHASADQFIASALKWFGDPEPDAGSPWERGERLAEFVRNQKTLLILDGLEPLQQPFGEEEGRIRDPSLQSLVRELANYNPGLCVITTRLDVDDLKDFSGTTVENIHLEYLSDEAGMELLKHLGVKGADDELKQAVRDFDGHALALMLLGTYLSLAYKGDVEKRDRIARLTKEKKYGGQARQVMASYEIMFKDKPELDILRMMGLFDRPAEGGVIEVLIAAPPIKGLTTKLNDLSHEDWQFALNNLRKAGLLAKEDPAMPDTLDCYPLIREHFGEKLKENNPEAWKEAHYRSYEYFKNHVKEYPDTIEEMSPLYAAVAHGCQAGRYQEAFDDVYRERIQRGNEYFNLYKLGAFGSDLAALSSFFGLPWDKPVAELTEADKAYVLGMAGFDLRALGRLKESAQPMQEGLEAMIPLEDWKNAARSANNLSELYLTLGDIALALEYANQSVDLADRSGDALERMDKRTTLADALHQAGRRSEAESLFREAEGMQKDRQPEFSMMYSLPGFQYCDLLLSQKKYQEVMIRAEQTIEIARRYNWHLAIALDYLTLGRAHLFQALQEGSQDFTQVAKHLNQAVDGLRQAGTLHHVPRGLLARAELYRVQGEFEQAQQDIEEAMTIAERGEMGLHQADCHLEYARLYLAMRDRDRAREHLAIARKMIKQIGYHRRDREVEELEAIL